MTPVVVSPRADADVDDMLEHLAEVAGPAVARRYSQQLDAIFERLAMFPASGARRRSLGPHTRVAVAPPYVVVYDYQGSTVVIVRVLDGRRNITHRLVRQ
ncbi:MAG: type II toxin-antitoxin system RelE/ParE family toxin [Rhodospirillales bacterium]|nr:type II toxin-antitoxin system RelE/ParE family toxin [Rhodospirillales bacterium]